MWLESSPISSPKWRFHLPKAQTSESRLKTSWSRWSLKQSQTDPLCLLLLPISWPQWLTSTPVLLPLPLLRRKFRSLFRGVEFLFPALTLVSPRLCTRLSSSGIWLLLASSRLLTRSPSTSIPAEEPSKQSVASKI